MDVRPKRTVKLPVVPPEVWICIFQRATYVPGTLVPEVYAEYSPTNPHPLIKDRHSALREALLTKHALVRVCKQWWHLAMPFLYRSVYIGRTRSIESLLETLKSYAMDKERQPLGAYTQRLDVAIRDHAGNPTAVLEQFDYLAALISHMTNLAIVCFALPPNYGVYSVPGSVLDALEHSAQSLRVLDWTYTRQEPSCARLATLLTRCTKLRVLSCQLLSWSKDMTRCHIPPSVTTLKVSHLATWPSALTNVTSSFNWEETPGSALRELTIEGQKELDHWDNFLRCCSSQLQSLQFWIPLRRIDVHESLHVIARICPNLRRLIITADRFPAIVRPNLILPPITYLGLRATNNQAIKSDFATLFSLLEELKTSVPSLRVVQLLSKHNVECLLKGHTKLAVRALKPYLEGSTFRIEDQDGVLLTNRLKELGHL